MGTKIHRIVSHPSVQVDDLLIAVKETEWADGGSSFDAYLPDGRCITESESFDSMPTEDELRGAADQFPRHSSTPHEPGYLYDCPACESHCFCGDPRYVQCVAHDRRHAEDM